MLVRINNSIFALTARLLRSIKLNPAVLEALAIWNNEVAMSTLVNKVNMIANKIIMEIKTTNSKLAAFLKLPVNIL